MAALKAKRSSRISSSVSLWGSTYLAIKIGVTDLPPFLFTGLRFLVRRRDSVVLARVIVIRCRAGAIGRPRHCRLLCSQAAESRGLGGAVRRIGYRQQSSS